MPSSTNSVLPSEPTISDVEQVVADGLEALRNAPLNDQITAALKFLTPPGYRPIAQFEEDGRKKRSTATASNWNPETGEIVIYFERTATESSHAGIATRPEPATVSPDASLARKHDHFARLNRHVQAGLREDPLRIPHAERKEVTHKHIMVTLAEPKVTDEEIAQLCMALADAEKAGKAFIALTWFRDSYLTTRDYTWADSPTYRQAVLTKAFDAGAILTSKIPNPKSQHPTTTLKLNRESSYAQSVAPRYQPIRAVGGASASDIVLRDRGRF